MSSPIILMFASQRSTRSLVRNGSTDAQQRTYEKEEAALSTLASSSSSSTSAATPEESKKTSNKYRKPSRWTASSPGALAGAGGDFTAGKAYVDQWQLPPPLVMSASLGATTASDAAQEAPEAESRAEIRGAAEEEDPQESDARIMEESRALWQTAAIKA
jgi:hypothetical protein